MLARCGLGISGRKYANAMTSGGIDKLSASSEFVNTLGITLQASTYRNKAECVAWRVTALHRGVAIERRKKK